MTYYVIIRGPLGCGKTTVAEALSKKLDAKHIAVDEFLSKHKLTADKEEGYISQRSFIKANEIIAPKAQEYLAKGVPVIFDGNFYWKSQVDDLIARLHFPHYVFTLNAPLELCIQRDEHRTTTHGKDAARVVYEKSTEFTFGTTVDVTKPLDKVVAEILTRLPL